MSDAPARILLVGGSGDTRAALAGHCAGGDIAAAADAAAALDYLRRRGVAAARQPRLRLIVLEAAANAAAAAAALKADAQAGVVPLVVLCNAGDAGVLADCYRAGANACVVKPAGAPALLEAMGALVAFWLEVNELPSAPD